MSQKTDLNISPYYDDFGESKKFHKILFRAGRPVQARELTQSQSLLQNQVQRFGDHMFKEGSIVNGAETDIDMDVEFVKLEATNPNTSGTTDVSSYIADFEGKIIQGETWVSLWIVADNVYGKGAALNAVQIAENLLEHNKLW